MIGRMKSAIEPRGRSVLTAQTRSTEGIDGQTVANHCLLTTVEDLVSRPRPASKEDEEDEEESEEIGGGGWFVALRFTLQNGCWELRTRGIL